MVLVRHARPHDRLRNRRGGLRAPNRRDAIPFSFSFLHEDGCSRVHKLRAVFPEKPII